MIIVLLLRSLFSWPNFSKYNMIESRQNLEHYLSRESGAEQQSAMLETKIRGVEKLTVCF